jgi:thiamine-monophosphate kinase
LADEHGVALIGGDVSSTPGPLTIDSFVIGHCPAGKALRRSGARAGDSVFVTGRLGASAAGLKLLLQGARPNENEGSLLQNALRAHLKPEPLVAFGREIAGLAHAAIDVSDGLARDLAHICRESGVDAIIDFTSVPVAEEVSLITLDQESSFDLAVNGGEDFELLFTASDGVKPQLIEAAENCRVQLTRIGEIIEKSENRLLLRRDGNVKPLLVHGYDHFRV